MAGPVLNVFEVAVEPHGGGGRADLAFNAGGKDRVVELKVFRGSADGSEAARAALRQALNKRVRTQFH